MTRANTLKLSLLGAVLSLGAIAANEGNTKQSKHMKENAEFVEKAAMFSKSQVDLSELAVSQSTNPAVKEFAQKVISDHKQAFNSLKEAAKEGGYSLPFASIGTKGMSTGERDVGDDSATRSDEGKGAGEQVGNAAGRAADDIADSSRRAAGEVKEGAQGAADELKGAPRISQSKDYAKESEKAQDKYNDLAKLSGEKFDKEYLSDITSANDKGIKLVEKTSKDGWDSNLKSWADETLPTLRQHEEMAKSVKQNIKNERPSM